MSCGPTSRYKKSLLSLALLFLFAEVASPQKNEYVDINSALMESTFFIVGPSSKNPNQSSLGTVFILSRPLNEKFGRAILLTAAHVLNDISGDTATVMTRKRLASGEFAIDPFKLQIRSNGKNQYVVNPDADVAAMVFPAGQRMTMPTIPTDWLINDDRLQKYGIHPGDNLFSLGFPEGANTTAFFPFLRTGVLSSYPLVPSKRMKLFYYDVSVYPGCSGGPVYFQYQDRYYEGVFHGAEIVNGIIGLVTQQIYPPAFSTGHEPLLIAAIVPASFIIDTINMLGVPK